MKLVKILIICIITISILITKSQAVSMQMQMTPEAEEYKAEEGKMVIIDLKLTDFVNITPDTVLGCYAEIEYDKELLSFVSIEGQNGWNVEYSTDTNKIVLDTDKANNNGDIIAKLRFNISQENISRDEKNVNIKLTNVTITDGYFKINTEAKTTISIISSNPNKDEPQKITQIYTKTGEKIENSKIYLIDETTHTNAILPFVGNDQILIIAIAILIILIIIFKIKSRKIKY